MKKMFLIIRSNIRKSKGQFIVIFLIMLLASIMLNLWLMLATDYKKNFDRYHEKLNAEHVTIVVTEEDDDMTTWIKNKLESDKRTMQYALDEVMMMVGSFAYHQGEVNTEFIILEKEVALNRSVGKIEIVEEGAFTSGIYLPMLYSTDKGYQIGDKIEIKIGNNQVEYTICGFLNSVMAGSHNCSMSALILTEDKYKELKDLQYAPVSMLVSIRIKDKETSEAYEAMLNNAIALQYPASRTLSNSYTLVSQSRYISQMICAGVLSAMAFFVIAIALIVIASNVANYIQENMKNLGAWKAIGYTSAQLISIFMMQFVGIVLVATLIGIFFSYLVYPLINQMMIAQTGIPYSIHFLPLAFFLTIFLIEGSVILAVWIPARKMKKIEPIVALRQGILTHNFKSNPIQLEKTKFPLHFALACKTTFALKKQNIIICLTMLVLCLIVTFSGLMVENVIVNMDPFVDLIVGETADSCININVSKEEAFLETLHQDERVEKVYLYNSIQVRHVNGLALIATLTDDFANVNNQNVVFKGRFPKYDNEIALAAKYANEQNLKIGDEIEVTADGRVAKYIITGLTQISNNLGKDCLLTRDGYERIGTLQNVSYYINCKKNTDIDLFQEEITKIFQEDINICLNIRSILAGTAGVYVSLMSIIVIAILVLSILIIAFVLYLLVRTTLNHKKHDYGIMKAIGFTSRQLIVQTALSFMPVVVLSTILGLLISIVVINPLTSLFLSGIGIVQCTFTVPIVFISILGIGLIGFSFLFICLFSVKIKKIAPRALLLGE